MDWGEREEEGRRRKEVREREGGKQEEIREKGRYRGGNERESRR